MMEVELHASETWGGVEEEEVEAAQGVQAGNRQAVLAYRCHLSHTNLALMVLFFSVLLSTFKRREILEKNQDIWLSLKILNFLAEVGSSAHKVAISEC